MKLWRWIRGGHWERWQDDRAQWFWVRTPNGRCFWDTGRKYGFGSPICEPHRSKR